MRRKVSGLAVVVAVAALVIGLVSSAAAAPRPQVKIISASHVGTSSAVLRARVHPNHSATSYYFTYGVTGALGTYTPEKTVSAKAGAKTVTAAIKGLLPGTVYSVSLRGFASTGLVVTRTITFRTQGYTPTEPLVGAAIVNSSTSATLTGVVNPARGYSGYEFLLETPSGAVIDSESAYVPASQGVTRVALRFDGLKPGTVYHYNLVTAPGTYYARKGAPHTFETFPNPRHSPGVTAHTVPKASTKKPYSFLTYGRIRNPNPVPSAKGCAGVATVSYFFRGKLLTRRYAPVTTGCRFYLSTDFYALKLARLKSEKVTVKVTFGGNHYLRPGTAHAESILLFRS